MVKIKEAIVVEGRYDAARLREIVDTAIVETAGFGVFRDEARLHLLRDLAETRGVIVLTDSDSAGFVIRSFLQGALPKGNIRHAYVPEIQGKERRKAQWSKEGLLGVEGVDAGIILEALRRAGATIVGELPAEEPEPVTRQELYEDGLIGAPDSAALRRELLRRLGYPEKLSTNRLLEVLNTAVGRCRYKDLLQQIREKPAKKE